MTRSERQTLLRHMRVPAITLLVLLALLVTNVFLGATLPFHGAYIVEGVVTLCMVLTVLLVSMEIIHEPPLIRLFSAVGFFWVAIMFGMTMVDYLSR